MNSTAPLKNKKEKTVDEKKYKTVEGAGILSLVLGIVTICCGVASGVLMIISGARLLSTKKDMLF